MFDVSRFIIIIVYGLLDYQVLESHLLVNIWKRCSIKVDGDVIRKYISYDLDYTLLDRKEQIRRVMGIGKFLFIQFISDYLNSLWIKKLLKNVRRIKSKLKIKKCKQLKIIPL